MSNEEGRLASLLLRESFGEVVEKVGTYLLLHGPCPLYEIKKNVGLEATVVSSQVLFVPFVVAVDVTAS